MENPSTTTLSKSEIDSMEAWISRLKQREVARQKNASPCYDEFTKLVEARKLDTTVKKCTALVRKFKGYTKSMLTPILKEIGVVNLTKYLSEVADVIAEAKFKMADIPDIITVCTMLHERYRDFSALLGDGFAKTLGSNEMPTKVNVPLCLCGELMVNGVLNCNQGYSIIYSCIGALVSGDKTGVQVVPTCLHFCSAVGEELAGLIPKHIRLGATQLNKVLPRSNIVSNEQLELMRNELEKHCTGLINSLTKLYKRTIESEKQNRRLLKYRGEIPPDRTDEHNRINLEFENLRNLAAKLCNELDTELPAFPPLPPNYDEDEKLVGLVKLDENLTTTDSGLLLYGDEETRSFYQDFPNLMVYLPPVAYKESVQEAAVEKEKVEQREKAMQYFDMEIESAKLKYVDDTYGSDDDDFREEIFPDAKPATTSFSIFLKGLRDCVSKDMIDAAAYEFVNSHNTKNNCKLLTQALVDLPIRRNDLIPLWSRFVAILAPVFPTITLELCKRLHYDLRRLVRKKNQFHLEIKLKVTRYIGELVKFRVFPKSDAFNCLRILVASFVHHQIEMACALVETCGKFLYLNYDSHQRMKLYLDAIMRKKNAKILESRYICLIDNAYYSVCPPEHVPHVAVVKSMIQLYMEYLLQGLTGRNLEDTIKDFRRLDWSDPEVRNCAITALSQPQNATFSQLQYYASLIAGLGEEQRDIITSIVDNVIDAMDDGLELNLGSHQARLSNIVFVGELYSYKLLSSDTVFLILYKLTSHGVSFDPNHPSEVDPPNNLFRLRLCCWLLKTCGVFFFGRKSSEKLRCFLIYFEYYYWKKRSLSSVLNSDNLQILPYSIVELFEETMEGFATGIRSGIPNCTSLFEAVQRMDELAKEIQNNSKFAEEIEDYTQKNVRSMDESQDLNSDPYAEHEDMQWPALDGQNNRGTGGNHRTSFNNVLNTIDENSVCQEMKSAETLENEEFDREFERMCAESLAVPARVSGEFRKVILEIPIPGRYKRPVLDSNSTGPGPNFYLLSKKQNKSNKDQLTPICIPADSVFFTKLKEREEADQKEKAEVKRLTLQMNELRIAEEEAIEEAKKKAAMESLLKLPKYRDTRRRTRECY